VLIPTVTVLLTQPTHAVTTDSRPTAVAAPQPRAFSFVRPEHPQIEAAPMQAARMHAPIRTTPIRTAALQAPITTTAKRQTRKVTSRRARPTTGQGVPELSVGGDRQAVLKFALSQVGQPYRRGGTGNGGWDCSGLVSAAYRSAGVSLPHSSGAIGREGHAVPAGQWRPGDVIASPGHVALYLGNGLMVEAANPHAGVRVTRVRPGTARRF
jgi:cell wall-associated NlpC family hydrolase